MEKTYCTYPMHTTLWGYMHLYYNSNVCNQQPEKESTDTDDLHTDHTLYRWIRTAACHTRDL